jgi:isoquinoline 1-oxidoreductase alpha subunit
VNARSPVRERAAIDPPQVAAYRSREYGALAVCRGRARDGAQNVERNRMLSLSINGQTHDLDIEPETPMLWVLRDEIGLTGTKFGCGIAQCGACTIHVNGDATRSCQFSAGDAVGKTILTIEGLGAAHLHAVQTAWIEKDVPQCGYCQSGQIMAAASLIARNPSPTNADIDAEITNICRCGTYPRIRAAIHRAAELARL